MEFEWDPEKNKMNLAKHGISFEEAINIFSGPTFTVEDVRRDYGEKRFISIGSISGLIMIVVLHTNRRKLVRIISARKANQNERAQYYGHLKAKT